MKNIFYFFIFISFLSCKEKDNYDFLILGDWQYIEEKASNSEEPPSPFPKRLPEISFQKNNIYINKDGFYKIDEIEKKQGFEEIRNTLFLGTNSKFKIEKDSLFLYNLISNKYEASLIVKIDKNTLILKSKSGIISKFKKQAPKNQIINPTFDAIIVTDEACFGTCPIKNTVITKEGNIFYFGESYNSKNGYFTGTFDKNKFEEFRKKLNLLRVEELENYYSVSATDLPTTNITIIKDGKIYKSVSDYGESSPRELIRIMNEIGYLYQSAQLYPSKFNTIKIRGEFTNDESFVQFTDSEKFYLQILLNNSKKTNLKFKPNFFGIGYIEPPKNFDYSDFKLLERKIETDGRFFKLENASQQKETFDLGYNFFERNNLIKLKEN